MTSVLRGPASFGSERRQYHKIRPRPCTSRSARACESPHARRSASSMAPQPRRGSRSYPERGVSSRREGSRSSPPSTRPAARAPKGVATVGRRATNRSATQARHTRRPVPPRPPRRPAARRVFPIPPPRDGEQPALAAGREFVDSCRRPMTVCRGRNVGRRRRASLARNDRGTFRSSLSLAIGTVVSIAPAVERPARTESSECGGA